MKQLVGLEIGNARWYAEIGGNVEHGFVRGDTNKEAHWVVYQRGIE